MQRPLCLLVIALATFAITTPAVARQWVVLQSEDPMIAVDVDSIKGSGDTRTFWSKVEYSTNSSSRRFKRTTSLNYINCATEQMGILQTTVYNSQGDVIYSGDQGDRKIPRELSRVVPESIGEAMLRYVCSLRSDIGRGSESDAPKTISRQQAINLIQQWLDAKQKIFAPPYNRSLINQLTTGKLQKELLAEDGPVEWLANNNAYYRYKTQKIGDVEQFSAGKTTAMIDLEITESRVFYRAGKLEQQASDSTADLIRYKLELVDNVWKIADYQVLKR